MGYTPEQLYRMTLSEFLNGYKGYFDHVEFEQQRAWERARFLLSGLVKDPPRLPWEKGEEGEDKEYTDEEKQAIVQSHQQVEQNATKRQILTSEGWQDVPG